MTTLLAFLFTLAVLIVFHELGHYAMARWAGVKVLRFSVGFGRVIAQRTDRHGTEWALSAMPLGGYVKMLDEREGTVAPADLPQAFNGKSLGARAAIVAAGPAANFLLAILLFWALFMVGVPASKAVLAPPPTGTVAAQAGLQGGVTLLEVNGEAVQSWQDAHWLMLKTALRGEAIELVAQNEGGGRQRYNLTPTPIDETQESNPLAKLGLMRALPPLPATIGQLTPDGSATQAGLRTGDRVVAINAHPVYLWEDLVNAVRQSPGQTLDLSVTRGQTQLRIRLTPLPVQEGHTLIGRIGAGPFLDPAVLEPLQTHAHYGVLDAMQRSLARTWDLSVFSLEMLGRMVMGEASLKNLSGPITIADYAGQSAQHGWSSYVAFLALVSISLGVLNLLPVPLLDGGHLLYYFAEFVTGHPVSERVQEYGQRIGMALLGTLMVFAFYNDLQRLFAG